MDILEAIDLLKEKGILFEDGLSAKRINKIENYYEIKLPPELER